MIKKKIFLFSCAIIILSSVVFSKAIRVTSPKSVDVWYKEDTYTIAWTTTGTMDSLVKIRLRNSANNAVILPIKDNIPNNGNYSWTIPASVPSGKFRIRVRTMDTEVLGDSAIFQIKNLSNPNISEPSIQTPVGQNSNLSGKKEIKIVFPNGGENLNLGDFINITWGYEGITNNIKLILYYNSTYKKGTIASNIPVSDKSYRWTVGYYNEGTANPKSGYQIEIQTMDGIYKDRSHFPFTICPESSALHPDFEIGYLVMNREYNFQLSALVKNNGKSYIGPIDFKITGIGKLTGKTIGKKTRILNKLISIQNVSLDVPERVVELMNLNWHPDVTYINFRVEIDPLKRIEELNEMNNISQWKIFFREETTKPDFLIEYIQYNSGHLYILIKNEGRKYNGGQVEFRVIGMDSLSNPQFSMDERVIKSIPPLDTAMGEVINLCDIDWPSNVNKISFRVIVDSDNKISEIYETNNDKEKDITK